jgi:hypothetical protein
MGFFKKIFKGIKKVFKKIGKGIKSAFKSIGKFMGKIGIIGQIGLALILPGIGQMLSGLLVGTGSTVGGLAGALQGMGAVGQAASNFIQGAVKIASNTSKFFSSVTDGVTNVIGETIGAIANKVPGLGDALKSITGGRLDITQKTFSSAWKVTQESMTNITKAGGNLFNLDPLSEVSVPQRTLKEIPEDSLMNEAPLREAIDSESALDALTKDRLQTEAAMARVGGEPLLGGDPFGPVGTIDGVTYMKGPPPSSLLSGSTGNIAETLTENIAQQSGAGTVADPFFASGKAAVAPEKSLLDKTSEFITGKSVDENLAYGRAKMREAVTDFIPETGKALGREAIAQATGLSPTAEQLRPIAYSSSVALGDFETSIGFNDYATSPYQSVINQVGPQYATSHPYGLMAQQFNFNQYQEQARARGVPA